MARIHLQPQLRDLSAGIAEIEIAGSTLRQIVAGLDERFPGIADRLLLRDAIAPGIAVSIDGVVTARGLLAAVQPASEIHFLPAIGGG